MTVAVAAGALVAGTASAAPAGFLTSVKPYAVPVGDQYRITALLSVGDRVPAASPPGRQYQMVGIPDGLGARLTENGTTEVFMNHELGSTAKSEPIIGAPLNNGAIVSRLVLAADGSVVSGERAYDRVYLGDTLVGPAAEEGNTTPGFGRFCSGSLAGLDEGLDRPIYFTNEESGGSATFDGRGGQAVAIYDHELHVLPALGHFAKENTLVAPGTAGKTVLMSLEDGPAGPESQLYMYVGDKVPGAPSVLRRNGLDNGRLYAFRADGRTNEADFASGSVTGTWVPMAGAETLSEDQLESAADAAGAFGFVRIEDGAFSRTDPATFYFDTTGGGTINTLGRLYRLNLDPANPTGPARLTIMENADQVDGAGGDSAFSPDNMDTSLDYLMVNEDGTAESRLEMAQRNRDGSIWRYDLNRDFARARIAQLAPPGRDGAAVGAGIWETSGIIDASSSFGRDSWLFDVQAHPPTAAPGSNTVEDGQLLLMRPAGAAALPLAGPGYWLAGADGRVHAFGGARLFGSAAGTKLSRPVVRLAAAPFGDGYWLVAADGGVFAYGDARFLGSTGAVKLNRPIAAMEVTPSGRGYWLVAADGGVFAFGDARFWGSTGALQLNQPIVAMAATPGGRGYWLVAADGGVFAFGDARFLGSTGAVKLNRPVVGIAASLSGNGYHLVASDGGIFAFGDATFL
ncbi:MAG: hypothetical protein ACRDY5_01355, partial [Acidimicrobiales bacterium]